MRSCQLSIVDFTRCCHYNKRLLIDSIGYVAFWGKKKHGGYRVFETNTLLCIESKGVISRFVKKVYFTALLHIWANF